MTDDLCVRGALILDGTGSPAYTGDITVSEGRIRTVGESAQGSAHRVVEADGLVVSPGFIDLHTHSDFTLPRFPRAQSMVRQGVTTQLTGNCGFSPFPVNPEHQDLLDEYVGFLDAGLPWGSWHTAAEYLDLLETLPLSSNVGVQVGHGSARIAAMGFAGSKPDATQMAQMEEGVREAMRAGAFGLSSGLTYAPASAAEMNELVSLATVVAQEGGFYSTHIRSEATTVVEALAEALGIGKRAGLPVQISHHKIMGKDNWPKVSETLAMIDSALDAGQDISLDQYPYTAGSTGLAVVLPRWALEGGVAAMQARLADPTQRERVRETITAQRREDLLAGLRVFEPDTIVIADIPPGPFAKYVGWTLSDVAADRRQPAVDTALDMLHAVGGDVLTIVHGQSEANLRRIMCHPQTAIASDGWTLSPEAGGRPHPRSYGTFARVLGRYVRAEHVLTLPEAIRKMTSLPARRLGLSDRGLLKPGFAADLVLFDPAQVIDHSTFDSPHQFSTGVDLVVVNGQVVMGDGEDTGVVAGRVLRHGRRAAK